MRKFKTLCGTPIENVVEYIRNYMLEHKDIEILIGSDSQSFSKRTVYGVVIVLYTPGKGGHVICTREIVAKERVLSVRLLNEVWKAIEVAEFLRESGLPLVKYIDIDLNPDEKFKSNTVLRQAIGMVEGMGYHARWKNHGALTTYSANHLVRQ
jgi:uncharacterized protein